MRSSREVIIKSGMVSLKGILTIPDSPKGLIIFAHGSGSGRLSPRNNFVAAELNRSGFATLLLDLLSPKEEADRLNVFDINLLSRRLLAATEWSLSDPGLADLPIGYFGASTGAAAAIVAAAEIPEAVKAVVSRGGRPDLAAESLRIVHSPTLLIVGGADYDVLGLNKEALLLIPSEKHLAVIPGATHLFEEPGALEEVAVLAVDWFSRYLKPEAGSLS